MDKHRLSETDICEKFISPALARAGWDVIEQVLREYPLRPGRMVVRGQRASRDIAPYCRPKMNCKLDCSAIGR